MITIKLYPINITIKLYSNHKKNYHYQNQIKISIKIYSNQTHNYKHMWLS